MEVGIARSFVGFLSIVIFHMLSTGKAVEGQRYISSYSNTWKLLKELADNRGTYPVLQQLTQPSHQITTNAQSKVVFPFPEDVVANYRSYLPDLGFLTDLAFLFFLPRGLPASGMVRLSRDLFESEECVQYVSCEMTKVARRHRYLDWINNFLQDFPFQGDVADRLRQGSMDAISKFNKRETVVEKNGTSTANSRYDGSRRQGEEICTFSCHPITSLSKGLKILSLLHDLVRTVK